MGETQQTWPAELDNDECAGPLQPDERARWRRSRVQTRLWTVVFALLGLACVVVLLVTYPRLGDPAPLHVGPHGVDRWGSRREYLITGIVALAGMVLCGPGLVWLMPKVPMSMTNSNSPSYWKTPERYAASMAHTSAFLMATMATCMVMVLAAEWGFWELANHRPFPDPLVYGSLVLLGVQMVVGIALLFRTMRPPQWWKDCRHAHGHRWD